MENKRILIHEDRAILNTIVEDLKIFVPAFTDLKKSFEALELGELTSEIFKSIVTGSEGIASIQKEYFEGLNITLNQAGLTRESLRKVHIDQANIDFENFNRCVTAFKNINPDPNGFRNHLSLTACDISFIDGRLQVSAMDEESILEKHCRIYLENTGEIELYARLKSVRDSINHFNSYLDDLAKRHELDGVESLNHARHLTTISALNEFLIDGPCDKEINPISIRWVSDMITRAKSNKAKSEARTFA